MRKTVALFLFGLFAVAAYADWALISTEDLLKKTDWIVVAKLTDVVEFTKDQQDFGRGTLVVSEVIRGSGTPVTKLVIEWSNPSRVACPRVEHRQHAGKPLIWLLQRSKNGATRADYPGRVLELQERGQLAALLKK